MNSAFRARWLASSEVISQVLFTSTFQIKLLFGPLVIKVAWYNYTKTIIQLSVGKSSGYLPPLQWIILNQWLSRPRKDTEPAELNRQNWNWRKTPTIITLPAKTKKAFT